MWAGIAGPRKISEGVTRTAAVLGEVAGSVQDPTKDTYTLSGREALDPGETRFPKGKRTSAQTRKGDQWPVLGCRSVLSVTLRGSLGLLQKNPSRLVSTSQG